MSEGKRVSLQSIGPAKKDKKCKPTSTTIRLTLTLPACNSDSFPDFNYNSLVLNERRRKEKNKDKDDKVNGAAPLDPYASDDDDNLRQMARSFESKYGTPKKKCRRLEDYTELGTGYDENDSFIDNTDAYDEVVPEDQAPEWNGFYINKGQLILKHVDGRSSSDSDSEESDGPQSSKSHKRPLSSESESSGSGSSSDDSDDSDDSEDSDEDVENEDEAETDESPKKSKIKELKEDKSNGHPVCPVLKKPKLLEASSKKAKSKAITGLFLKKAVREKEHNEKRQKADTSDKEPCEKRQKADSSDKEPCEKRQKADSSDKEPCEKRQKIESSENNHSERNQKFDSEGVRRLSNVDAAIEAVARGEDSKESGIAESKSRSGSSDESDMEETHNSMKVNGQANGASNLPMRHPLPEDLPENILSVITSLKEVAAKNCNLGKQQFFTAEVNGLLLKFEKLMRLVPRDKKGGVYDHLECFLPCRKETIMKRGKVLLLESVETAVEDQLTKLKAGIDSIMPTAVERYLSMCEKYKSYNDQTDANKPPSEKTKIPRRRFPWTDELKNTLCLAVKKRRVYYGTVKQKGEIWTDHLSEFLKIDVVPMWKTGWMKVSTLTEIISKMAIDLLQFKPVSPTNKIKKAPPCLTSKKTVPKAMPDDVVKSDTFIRKPNPSSSGVTGTSKPLQTINLQNQPSSVLKSSSESSVKSTSLLSNGTTTVSSSVIPRGTLPIVNQTSSFNLLDSEIVECIRTSLANSLVSVTPVQTSTFLPAGSQASSAIMDSGTKVRNVPASSLPIKKALNSSVDIINLQTNGMDSSVEIVPKIRLPATNSSLQSGHLSANSLQTLNSDVQDLSKPQASSPLMNVPPSLSSQLTSYQPSSSPNSIKVSSVSAINLKLSGSHSPAVSSKTVHSQPLKAHSQQNVLTSSSVRSGSHSPTMSNKVVLPQPFKAHTQQNVPTSSSSVHSGSHSPTHPLKAHSQLNVPISSSSMQSGSHSTTVLSKAALSQPLKAHTQHNVTALSSSVHSGSQSTTVLSKTVLSLPLKAHTQQNVPTSSSSGHQTASSFSQSVISHGLETSNRGLGSSLTITPVKSSTSSNAYYQQAKASGHSSIHSVSSSVVSQANSNTRSEVIVTPSSNLSMPHIKSTGVNLTTSSANIVSSSNIYSGSHSGGNNLSTTLSGANSTFSNSRVSNSYQNSPGIGGSSYSNLLSNPDVSVRTQRQQSHTNSSVSKIQSTEKTNFAQTSRSHVPDKSPYMPLNMWQSSVSVDGPRSSSASPSSVKSVTPSPEKAMVSRKDRILQDSRERGSNDPAMPTLSGPFRSSNATSNHTSAVRNQMQPNHNPKKKSILEMSELDMEMAMGSSHPASSRADSKPLSKQEESLQKAQGLAMQSNLMSRTNCDSSFVEEPWGAAMKKTVANKPSKAQ